MLLFIISIIFVFLVILMILLFCSKRKKQNDDTSVTDSKNIHFKFGIFKEVLYTEFDYEIHKDKKDNTNTQA